MFSCRNGSGIVREDAIVLGRRCSCYSGVVGVVEDIPVVREGFAARKEAPLSKRTYWYSRGRTGTREEVM